MTNEAHIAAVHDDIGDPRNASEVIRMVADIESGRPIRLNIHISTVDIEPGMTPVALMPLLIFLGEHLIILRRRRRAARH